MTNSPTTSGPFELVDNGSLGSHRDALEYISAYYAGPLQVATAYITLEGLDTLAGVSSAHGVSGRLLIGTSPEAGDLIGPRAESVSDLFERSVAALRRERDFSSFPADRRAVLERVTAFIGSDDTQVRRYGAKFLHGKAYIAGELDSAQPGAAMVSSANLTYGGLVSNLELGMAHYQPNVVEEARRWYADLWREADDFKDELLDLLLPPVLESDPQTVFLRALLELYGDDFEDQPAQITDNLTRFQREGYERARRILERYGGVLYADGVGMGKTEIGVRFIREYTQELGQHALIISPAQLRDEMWQRRLDAENLPGQVVSYQELAQDMQLTEREGRRRVLPVDKDVYRLIVIDEAHAYRNLGNTWYAALDRLMGGSSKKLVMLTATPVNNSLWDLHNLFLLFARHDAAFVERPLGIPSLRQFFIQAGANRDDELSEAALFPLIDALTVRRDRAFIQEQYGMERFEDGTEVRFPRPELRERRYDLDGAHPGVVRDIERGIDSLKMARYRPSAYRRDGSGESASEEALAGLIQSQMLKRFESSWSSALQTVSRMKIANEVVISAIDENGIVPPPAVIAELAGSFSEDDTGLSPDLISEALSETEDGLPASRFTEDFLSDLKRDRDVLTSIQGRLEGLGDQPDPKLHALRAVMESTPAAKVAIFTSFQDTATYLKEHIKRDPKLLGNRSWTVVIGAETDANARTRELERFCPESVTGDSEYDPPGGEVDALLSTDILSEGQNLQQAQAVVSFDMPWNPQRVVQRNGRIIRLRSPHETAYLYTLLPEQGELETLLRLESKLQSKIRAANVSVGMETPVLAGVKSESQIYADLESFANRLASGDLSLMDEEQAGATGSAFAGELFRSYIQRAISEGEIDRLRNMSWGMGAAFVREGSGLVEPAVFFACRTRQDERYWRMVSASGEILSRDDLPMLRVIDPGNRLGCDIPPDVDLEHLFQVAAEDICEVHNASLTPEARFAALPASQRWALDVLRSPEVPLEERYDTADMALSTRRNSLVQRALSALRREYTQGGMSAPDCAVRIVEVVNRFGLRPVEAPALSEPIGEDDLGVVCFQVVLSDSQS